MRTGGMLSPFVHLLAAGNVRKGKRQRGVRVLSHRQVMIEHK
jgi:hypothetical protein